MGKKLLLCGTILAASSLNAKFMVIKTEEDYKKNILDNNGPVIIKFAADWCSVCKNVEKPFEEVARDPSLDYITFVQVNVDELDAISKQNAIVGVPTFVYRDKGQKIMEEVGVQNMQDFKKHLHDNITNNFNNSGVKNINTADMVEKIDEKVENTVNHVVEESQGIAATMMSFCMAIISSIKNFFMTIVDAIKGFFGN